MNESVLKAIKKDGDLERQVGKLVRMATNSIQNPVVTTAEVAEALEVSKAAAFEALEASPHTDQKAAGDTHVWW